MIKFVNFEISKLLKEKGYSWECKDFYRKGKHDKNFFLTTGVDYDSDRDCIWDWNLNGGKSGMLSKTIPYPNESDAKYYSAPVIGEVVMWLHEKHEIWITVNYNPNHKIWDYNYDNVNWTKEEFNNKLKQDIDKIINNTFNPKDKFDSPTEAYEAAIEYVLKNLI